MLSFIFREMLSVDFGVLFFGIVFLACRVFGMMRLRAAVDFVPAIDAPAWI